jgi:hypothetical protein
MQYPGAGSSGDGITGVAQECQVLIFRPQASR